MAYPYDGFGNRLPFGSNGQVIDRPPQLEAPQFGGPPIDGQVINRAPQLGGQVIDRGPQFGGPPLGGQVINRNPFLANLANWNAWMNYGRR